MTATNSLSDILSVERKGPIYLDNQATTPTDPRVVEAMLPFFGNKFGNPHSTSHAFGWEAEDAVSEARQRIADLIGAKPREIIFTSGATESNNLALKGAARFPHRKGNHIITTVVEHKCVLETCRRLESEGIRVTYLGVDHNGLIDVTELARAIDEETIAVSIMAVNNETGVIQPLEEIGEVCREAGAYFHTDAAQAVGKIPLSVNSLNIDLLSVSGHKLYGPMGVGALYVRRRPRVRLQPLIDGGGQEQGLRAGTLPTPLCVGLGQACVLMAEELSEEANRLMDLRSLFLEWLTDARCAFEVNGDMQNRVPGNLNIRFDGIRAEDLLTGLRGVAISTGSACTSASVEPSYVLRAMGLSHEDAGASVRIGFGRFTTEEEVRSAADQLVSAVNKQRDENRKLKTIDGIVQDAAPAA